MKRGIAICHYNRHRNLPHILDGIQKTVPKDVDIIVCDDGSDNVEELIKFCKPYPVLIGRNIGVAWNKNRALFALQSYDFICILEDDLIPIKEGWFDLYEQASILSGIHHFCRVQDKMVTSTSESFDRFMGEHGYTPICGPSPRGDLTFITKKVVETVGGFNPKFLGAGYAHGEWSNRVEAAGLINHPQKWVDFKETSESFEQIGDTEGGRWVSPERVKAQIERNKKVLQELQEKSQSYVPIRCN